MNFSVEIIWISAVFIFYLAMCLMKKAHETEKILSDELYAKRIFYYSEFDAALVAFNLIRGVDMVKNSYCMICLSCYGVKIEIVFSKL